MSDRGWYRWNLFFAGVNLVQAFTPRTVWAWVHFAFFLLSMAGAYVMWYVIKQKQGAKA